MVAPVRKETGLTKVSAPPFSQPKPETKQHKANQTAFRSWANRLLLSGFLLLLWCFLNAFILTETMTHNWQKQQVSLRKMQVHQIQTEIAHRLSDLKKNSSSLVQLTEPPTLLGINSQKQRSTLLGRR